MDFIPRDFIFFINSSKKEDIQSRATKANSICENIRHVYEDLEAHIKEQTDSKYDSRKKLEFLRICVFCNRRYREFVLWQKLEFYDFITSLGNGTLEKHKETINKLESTAEDLDSLRNVRISNLRFPDREITELFDKLGTVLII